MGKPVLVYHSGFHLDLGEHVFPGSKYQEVYTAIARNGLLPNLKELQPQSVQSKDLLLVHSREYLSDFIKAKHTYRTYLSEMPLDESIVRAFLLMCGGTILAGKEALNTGVAINLAGGFHHAYPCHAEGFCYLNDLAVAARVLVREALIKKAIILDLDLHQGNGTAYIFRNDDRIFTCSIHQEDIYPPKERSDLDVGLRRGVEDEEYLDILEQTLKDIRKSSGGDLVFVVAGADILLSDSLGQLMLTREGLKERDLMVIEWAKHLGMAIAFTLGGGYSRHLQDTVNIHTGTVEAVMRNFS